jgi:hypothetical protein
MKSYLKNPIWHLTIGLFFLALAIFLLVHLIIYQWESRAELIRDVVRFILCTLFGTSSLIKWHKIRQAKNNISSEKEMKL